MNAVAFIDRLLPAPLGGGFALDDHWVWCGSVVRGEDNRYHMFASRWSKSVPFWPYWVSNSEIVRASADTPVGPYQFEEVVLPPRGNQFWDGRMTHNPTVHRHGDEFLLFYTGTTYQAPMPTPRTPFRQGDALFLEARANQRIGLATSGSVQGPWTRPDQPLLLPRPGKWDALMTTNPAPCVRENGSVLLAYKSTAHQKDKLRYGVAGAERLHGPYERLDDEPVFRFANGVDHIEDAYVWQQDGMYQLLMKDMEGGVGGEKGGGVHALSDNGVAWRLAPRPHAYSRTVHWDDGATTTQAHLERPQLLVENGRATHLFAATGESADGSWNFDRSWNLVIPLRPDPA